jgi:hypothetical protein
MEMGNQLHAPIDFTISKKEHRYSIFKRLDGRAVKITS